MKVNTIIQGDCIEEMRKLDENSVDAIITDPPYGLGFMNKEWDNPNKHRELVEREKRRSKERKAEGKSPTDAPFSQSVQPGLAIKGAKENRWFQEWSEKWSKEALRVLKPGGYMLVFCATRMYHRMTCGIEDAGFEIRDTIMWLYGSGFPKSLNIGKQIDKIAGRNAENEKEISEFLKKRRLELGLSMKEVEEKMGWHSWINWIEGRNYKGEFIIRTPTWKDYQKLKEIYKIDDRFDKYIKEAEREVVGKTESTYGYQKDGERWDKEHYITKAELPEAKQWEGWGTALKPACEPIVVARKPLSEKNVALNVLKWGTGGLNIDECRIKYQSKDDMEIRKNLHREENIIDGKVFGGGKYRSREDVR